MPDIKISNGAKQEVLEKINNYLKLFPDEKNDLAGLIEQLQNKENIFDRSNMDGHITVSGLVISEDKKILMVLHKQLQKYLAPGGHMESQDPDMLSAARREILEETSLKHTPPHPWTIKNKCPLIIDTHPIPANDKKAEGQHRHHDFMFLFKTTDNKVSIDTNEVSHFQWLEIANTDSVPPNLARALKKLQKLNIL